MTLPSGRAGPAGAGGAAGRAGAWSRARIRRQWRGDRAVAELDDAASRLVLARSPAMRWRRRGKICMLAAAIAVMPT
jgi:hypothetical protein